jgi:catalase
MKNKKPVVCLVVGMACGIVFAHAQASLPALYQEYPQPNEDQQFSHYAEEIRDIQQKLAKGAPIERAFHSKAHGCLKGTFTVLDTIPDDAKNGVFVAGATYPMVGRFSNASGRSQKDKDLDLRGLALKLDLGNSLTQDFLMTNGPVEFVKNPEQFMEFAQAGAEGFLGMAKFFVTHLEATKTIIKQTSRSVPSLTTETFWSRTPFKVGPKAMKFNVVPCMPEKLKMPHHPSDTYLTDDLRERAQQGRICYEFRIQFQKDPIAQPMEDATVEWLEKDTPSIPVARVVFDQQSFDSTEQMQACQDMSFSPWHNVPDLRPMGSLNRARKYVYPSSAAFRGANDSTFRGANDNK